jgi:hypothetical protein
MPTGTLPEAGAKLHKKIYDEAMKGSCNGDEKCSASKAWAGVKAAGYSQDAEGNWSKKSAIEGFSFAIIKASQDTRTGEKRWRAVASDTEVDSYNDSMTIELFSDFQKRIEEVEQPPEDFRSEFWSGGIPYLSVSHYPDLSGKAVPGEVDAVYVDGNRLKARGRFANSPLGEAAFKSVYADLQNKATTDNKVRISIAFLDYMHKHNSNGYTFDRSNVEDDFCPECLKEAITGKKAGKIFMRGHLIHLAMTRVPVNTRTEMEVDRAMTTRKEDAASIIGEELAAEIEDAAKIVGKSEALIIKADDEIVEEAKTVLEGNEDVGKDAELDDAQEDEEAKKEEEELNKKNPPLKKSEAVPTQERPSWVDEILIALKSDITQVEPVSTHPLDTVFAQLKADYDDAVSSMDLNPEEKLRLVQDAYTSLGETIKTNVSKEKEISTTSEGSDIKMLSESVSRLAQRMDMLFAKLEAQPTSADISSIPARRSIKPTLTMQSDIVQPAQARQPKSATPNLRAIIDRTT